MSSTVLAQSQREMNNTACTQSKSADTELNKVYGQILRDYKADTLFIEKLKQAQRAWLQYRDAHLAALYPGDPSQYGSVNSMCQCQVLEQLTANRVTELKQWLQGVEGDVCSGSVQPKNDLPKGD
ncbi:lysozyme inhibitor LprI family protein [Candidatus Cyanaurora vandensis]|uniref:lysozyme inhibitor LprI family protein n=1 Tax=Candidatus Cyanaurora vandensis TaxID=2714958 RepID=UPI00257C12FD|nr:lysozyme inhibitor LprI family protein [Candidatus Cyanaurora vandensis]